MFRPWEATGSSESRDPTPASQRPRLQPRSQFLRSLYSRAAAAAAAAREGSSNEFVPASQSSSSNSTVESVSRSTASHSMLGRLRRADAQPTVELARPAPEVEFSRVADVVQPVLRNYASAAPASLLSLQAKHQESSYPPDTPLSASSLVDRRAGDANHSMVFDSADSDIGDDVGCTHEAQIAPGAAYFSDERDVPFRSNAVEIAAQDDKQECAFLQHELLGIGSESERARSILSQLTGQLHPTTTMGSEPSSHGRKLTRPVASSKTFDEIDVIYDLNQQARERVAGMDPATVMAQFPLHHLRVVIRQLLDEVEVSEDSGWDSVICDLAVCAVSRVRPNVRGGDKMDLRHYVRIKRVPGAQPSDSQYISGIVFTKNLAHRLMPRFLHSPRIMLLTLPLEYVGPGSRYVAFDEGLRLQRGYTEKLIQRITRAAPTLVLADKPVPRQVMEGLMRNRIAVAQCVKRSVIRAVARCTGADIVSSMDRFSDYPRAGTCDTLAVQTYEHPSLPEFRKSFMFLDGCIEHLGGTIVLRGDSFEKLSEIKQVVDLVVCLSYSMFLETSLLLDEYALAAPGKYELELLNSKTYNEVRMRPADNTSLALQALNEYNLVLSSSPCVRIPPPHVLVCMREKELAIREIAEKFDKMSSTRKDAPFLDSTGGNSSAVASTGVSFLVSRQQSAASSNRMRQQYESELALHETYLHEGRMFLQANPHAVSLWDYQSIVVAYMVTCRKHDYCLCAGPQCHLIPFYTGSDATLGQYLEICFDLTNICPSGSRRCTHPMYEHRHSYIHNHGRVDVTMDEYPCPIERLSEVLLMWSECTRCHKHTPVVPVTDETWCYSFGKYLEITFYNAQLLPRASICSHDIHKDFVRCFALHNMVVRFEYSEFRIWSIATPTTPLYFNMEVSIRLKEEEAVELRKKMDAYYTSLLSRLDAFPLDLVFEEKADDCRHVLHALSARAATEQVYFQQTLEQTLRNTHPADTLVIVVVYEALQGKVVEWNLQFSDIVQSFIQLDATSRASKRSANAPEVSTGLSSAAGHEIDSLEIIDELHSAADHHYTPGDTAAHVTARFEMPHLGSSPSNSPNLELTADEAQKANKMMPQKMSRLHRRLSMAMMRQERERQERQQEKHRRAAELADSRNRVSKLAHKIKGQTLSQSPRNHHHNHHQQLQHPSALDRSGSGEQKYDSLAAKNLAKAVYPSTYSTSRLIGHIATDMDDAVRIPRQTEFPELRNRKGKAKARVAGLINKSAQPLLDILQKVSPNTANSDLAGDGDNAVATEDRPKEGAAAPSRIPVIRPQQLQQQQHQRQNEKSDLKGARARPLSSFGRPPNARNSNIPRPTNIRSRTTSPTNEGDGRGGRSSSNVFLRLAKRLNGAKGQSAAPAVLGTVPRKMNMLLPAAAQYISQHPKRPSMPQVQVFYTKPTSEEPSVRRQTPPRRHSYQVSAEGHSGLPLANSAHGSSRTPQRPAHTRLPNVVSGHTSVTPGQMQSGASGDNPATRHRSATVSQVHTPSPSDGLAQSRPTTPYHPSFPPSSRVRDVQTPVIDEEDSTRDPSVRKGRNSSSSLRPSNIIPTLTRRLGLGFGFKSTAHVDDKTEKGDTVADSTDDEAVFAGRKPRSRVVSSSSNRSSLHERAPIPPRLIIDNKSRPSLPLAGSRPGSRRVSYGKAVASLEENYSPVSASFSSHSVPISIDSSSSSDIEIDDELPIMHSVLHTPVGTMPKSHRSSYYLDDYGSEYASASSSGAPIDLLITSPIRSLNRHPARLSQHLSSSANDSDSGAGTRGGEVRSMLDSLRRMNSRRNPHYRDPSTSDELDTHKPDLHFGQSDAGSDAEIIGHANDREAKRAAAYLQSVIASNTAASGNQVVDFSRESSAASASATTIFGLPLTKTNSTEPDPDAPGAGVGSTSAGTGTVTAPSGVGDFSATNIVPQENINTIWKTISNLLMAPETSQLFQIGLDLVYPLGPTEHVIAGSPIIVRESEPSSIIAFTLLDGEFKKMLHSLFEDARNGADVGRYGYAHNADDTSQQSVEIFGGEIENRSPMNEFSKVTPSRDENEVIKRVMLQSQGHHLRFRFTAGQTKFMCKVFYAAQFEALRRCNGCEDSYIESLSRCMPYIAKGGKSGSAFLRTRDERFIIKQIPKAETEAFLNFAPFYFEHMYWNWKYKDTRPTVLAKIFGFCRVTCQNAANGGKPVKMSVVIMENLFYGRKCSPVFDLKGSERNRMVEETSSTAVFQDENLIKYIRENPICIRQQTKRHLHDAIWNDTLFLSKMNVMDYSLLVGFDETSKQLVVGIVDFIRTFTWDKQLESWVKKAGILGGGGKGPTIDSPKQYKNRFRDAMERYFLMVPDKFFQVQSEGG
ncbi:Mitochondrial distribution and morphology protein 12 [Coemansia sp. RSA 1365]|nr:Mitochondrial distribution and morphology protein 12 [Coemansia sp. RSA 1365]